MYRKIFLKKNFFLDKIYIKSKISLSLNLMRVIFVVIFDKTNDLDKMKNLSYTRKFEILNLKNDGILSFAVNQENCVDNILENQLRVGKI